MNELPVPLVSAEVDLKDFAFTPMYRARLFGSAFHARATDAEWRAGVTLWLKSQDQVPAGSLPDDDIELCRLAELGRDLKTWRKIRAGALHGWIRCSDGRLYNRVVAEIVNEQWQGKLNQRHRTLKARIANLERRLAVASDSRTKADIEDQLQSMRQTLSQTFESVEKISVTEVATASKGERQRKGQGQGILEKEDATASPPPEDTTPEIPLSLVRPEADDWAKALFREGLAWLAKVYGGQPNQARGLIGKWLKTAGNDHRRVFRLLAEAQAQQIGDPKAWITAALKASPSVPGEPRAGAHQPLDGADLADLWEREQRARAAAVGESSGKPGNSEAAE